MGGVTREHRRELTLLRWGRVAAAGVLILAAVAWFGWATGIQALTRIHPSWPPMKPWTALWMAALAVAILVQSGNPSLMRIWVGRGLAAAVGVTTVTILAEYATRRTFGVDPFWFGEAVRRIQPVLPGRPSPQTVSSALFLSVPVALTRSRRRWTHAAWVGCLVAAMVMPFVTIVAYLFGAVALLRIGSSTGMALTTAVALLLLGASIVLLRPAWLLDRSDRWSLTRLGMILAGFPLLVGLTRRALLGLSFRDDLALTIATAVGTIVLATAAYRLSRREFLLREAHESDRILLRASLDGMIDPQVLLETVRDPNGRVVDFRYREVNQATCNYLGLERGELLGHGLLELAPGVAEVGLFDQYVECLRTGQPVIINDLTYDNEIIDDSRRYDLRATRATANSISLTWRDVTDRFEAAQNLQHASDLLRASADAMLDPQAVVEAITDPVGTVVDLVLRDVNKAYCDYLGVSRSDLVDRSMPALFPNVVSSGLMALYARCATTGEPVELDDFEYLIDPVGKPRRFDIRVARVRPGLLTGTIRDTTERFAAAQRLAASEEQYRLLAMNSTDTIVHIRDGVAVWVSPSVEDLLGAPPEHWLGRPVREVVPLAEVAEFERQWALVAAGESVQARVAVVAVDGVTHWAHLHAAPFFDADGVRDGSTASLRLIDAEVEQEEENRRLADQLHAEMASAKDYVTSILPDDLHGEVEITSRYLPAMDLGGDGFHFRWLDDDHLKIYLIDVSGHGIRPALLSVSVHNLIRSEALPMSTLLNPARLLDKLNRDFPMDDQGDTYFTIWYGVYQKSTRTLRYASAGHPPALALNRNGDTMTATALSTVGTPIGVFDEATYTTDSYTVPPGGQLLLYSDGAYEFENRTTAEDPMMSHRDFATICATMAARPDWSLDLLVDRLQTLSPDGQFDDDCALVLAAFA